MNKQTREEVNMYINSGWKYEEENEDGVILKKNTATIMGHIAIFIVFGWWTLGIANAGYHLLNNKTKLILK